MASALIALSVALLFLFLKDEEPATQLFHNEGKVFGTYYNIRYWGTADLHDSINAAFQAFDNSLSMFNPHSTLSAINANRDTVTDAYLEAMWAEAEEVYTLSGGAFDITVAPLVNYWGFGSKKSNSASGLTGEAGLSAEPSDSVSGLLAFVGFDKVELIDHKVIKSDPRVQIDGGAVAKGQACDMIAALLREHGCENYLVDIGGEIVTRGEREPGEPWRVGITKPKLNNEGAEKDLQQILAVRDICMATSGNYRNFYYAGEERRSHTIDPRTGYPVQHSVLSATVVSTSCMKADALATACMVLGEENALAMIERSGDAACYLLVAKGDSLVAVPSQNWEKTLEKSK